jgi:hypothetical protein
MRRILASILFVSAGCPDEPEEGSGNDTGTGTDPSSTGMSGSSASTSSTTTTDSSTTEMPPTSDPSESGSTTMVAEESSSSGGSGIECEWFDEPDGERSWGLCSPSQTWDLAEAHCVSEGGNLVSINGPDDGVFAINVIGSVAEVWIGLNDIDTVDMYEWSDGNPYEHMNWDKTQPDNPDHRCVAIGMNRRWYDFACDEHRVFVCARPL